MFDLGFGEIAILAVVLLIVVGPRELPRLLRAVGRSIHKLRTMSWELRNQSGIDEIIRDEDLQKDIEAVRSLSKGRVVDAIVNEAMRPPRGSKAAKPRDQDLGDDEPRDAAYASESEEAGEDPYTTDDDEPVEIERSGKPARRGKAAAGDAAPDESGGKAEGQGADGAERPPEAAPADEAPDSDSEVLKW